MKDIDGQEVAGVCHARGGSAALPAQWLIYITVEDLDHSMAECQRLGGAILMPPRGYAAGRYCVIKDPAGAVCALYQPNDAA
jgi:predicted enzyme related to lactoylglutathione lyase